MHKKIFLILAITLLCGRVKSQNNEQIIFERIGYVFNLKPIIDKKYWKDFDKKKFDVPLMYFTDSSSYVANPPADFVRYFKPKLVFQNRNIKIFKTLKRFDDIPFHMETVSENEEAAKNNVLPTPIMNCSSFEETAKKIPETTSTEYWVTMILHEYFHGFQFKHRPYLDATITASGKVSEDSLSKIYKANVWFQEKIKNENAYLLKAIQSTDQSETVNFIDSFFNTRKERRLDIKRKLNFEIDEYEKIYETMEGTARYIEYNLQVEFATKKPDQKLSKVDSAYHSYEIFKNYKIENDPWLYTPGNRYFYATGFNLVRLLDKLKIHYKTRLFKEGNLSLEQLLRPKKQNSR